MKVELKDAKVELEVGDGKSSLYINGHCIELPKVVGIRLIFGDDAVDTATKAKTKSPTPPTRESKKEIKRGCQSAASKRRLSESLKKFHAKKRRKEKEQASAKLHQKLVPAKKKTTSGKVNHSHLNGVHVN